MSPNEVIHHIKDSRELTRIWNAFARQEKEEVLKRMETRHATDIERTVLEVKTGQNRLF